MDSDYDPPVQIRIRKASDAPSLASLSEQRRAGAVPAPLASFESLGEESDYHSDADDAFEQETPTASPPNVPYDTLDNEGSTFFSSQFGQVLDIPATTYSRGGVTNYQTLDSTESEMDTTGTPVNEEPPTQFGGESVGASGAEANVIDTYDDGDEILNLNLQVAPTDSDMGSSGMSNNTIDMDMFNTGTAISVDPGNNVSENQVNQKSSAPPRPPPAGAPRRPPPPTAKSKPPPPRPVRPPSAKSPQPEEDDKELEDINTVSDPSYVERKYGKLAVETSSTSRPRSTTPINLASLDDYLDLQEPAQEEDITSPSQPEKIKISLPGKEFKRAKSPKDKSYINFEDGPLFNQSALVNVGGDEETDSPKRVLVPKGAPKRPAPPPPSSLRGKTLPQNAEWENFETPSIAPPPAVTRRPYPAEDLNGASGIDTKLIM